MCGKGECVVWRCEVHCLIWHCHISQQYVLLVTINPVMVEIEEGLEGWQRREKKEMEKWEVNGEWERVGLSCVGDGEEDGRCGRNERWMERGEKMWVKAKEEALERWRWSQRRKARLIEESLNTWKTGERDEYFFYLVRFKVDRIPVW